MTNRNGVKSNDKMMENAANALGGSTPELYKAGKWNPMENDGTALKLAVRLELDIITPTKDDSMAYCKTKDGSIVTKGLSTFTDPFSGVRRAIVMAASKVFQFQEEKGIKPTFLRDSINNLPVNKKYV